MEKLCIFFVVALITCQCITMSLGHTIGATGLPRVPNPRQYGQEQPQVTTSPTTAGAGGTTTTTMSPSVKECIRSCPVTAEFNPVCGSDLVLYSNPGRLYCAQACGVDVKFHSPAPCPTTTMAPPQPTKKV